VSEPLVWLTFFVLAAFVGVEVLSKVSSILHTPLMSGANAILGVILVGAMLVAGTAESTGELIMALLAVVLASINMVGGFVVTDRMLMMFSNRRRAVDKPRRAELER
jgi:NAD(P) transhydrogenase subunit alpha